MSTNRGLSMYLNSRPNYPGNKQKFPADGSISLTSSILEPNMQENIKDA